MSTKATLCRQELAFLVSRATIGRERIQSASVAPDQQKTPPVFSASRIADFLGRPKSWMTTVLKDLNKGKTLDGNVQRYDITQSELNKLIAAIAPITPDIGYKHGRRRAKVFSIISQKGGVAKSTTAVHFAHYLALQRYKTLLIDMDAQASATAFLAVSVPDLAFVEENTMSPIITGEISDIRPLIHKVSHFENLDFIPACTGLSNANELAYKRQFENNVRAEIYKEFGKPYKADPYRFYEQMSNAIDAIRDDYDVIVIDAPPHISAVGYNCLYASDILVVPTGASMIDFASTLRFIEWIDTFAGLVPGYSYDKLKFMLTNFDGGGAQQEAELIIRTILADSVLPINAIHSSEIQRAGLQLKSIYEVSKPIGSRSAWTRACTSMDEVNNQLLNILKDVLRTEAVLPNPAR